MKQKAFFIIFEGLSLREIKKLKGETPTLIKLLAFSLQTPAQVFTVKLAKFSANTLLVEKLRATTSKYIFLTQYQGFGLINTAIVREDL